MRSRALNCTALGLLITPASAATAAAGATAQGTATAAVVMPIAVVREADLDFGTLAVSPAMGGAVTVTPLGGGATYAGGVAGICATACAPVHPARFLVRGEAGRAYQVSLPDRLTLAVPGMDSTLEVDSLVAAAASAPGASRGILSDQGQDRFEVGATLHLPAAAPAARYTIQVPVIVTYL